MITAAASRSRRDSSKVRAFMDTTVAELSDSRVRVEVEVDASDVRRRLKETASGMGRDMKVPGFRKGKVPPEMVLQRVGRDAVLNETVQRYLPDWYELALLDGGVDPIGEPEVQVSELPRDGEPLRFAIEVGVLPKAEVGEWKGIEVGREEPDVPDEIVERELDRIREGAARLNPVERAAAEGDAVVIDYTGTIDGEEFEGGSATDSLIEVGGGQVLEDFDRALKGASAGDEVTAEVTFPDDYPASDVAGKQANFAIKVKEVREKELPELDDDFASEASEFDTLDELRAEISGRVKEVLESRIAEQFREDALDAVAEQAKVDLPEPIVKARAAEMWSRMERRLAQQGINPEQYLQAQEKSRDDVIADAEPDALRSLKREAVLSAIAESEQIEVSEEDMLDALQIPPGHEDHGHPEPEQALADLRKSGRDALLARDLRMRRAIDLIAENAKPIPAAQAKVRDQMWTPEKERQEEAEQGEGLWTPGS